MTSRRRTTVVALATVVVSASLVALAVITVFRSWFGASEYFVVTDFRCVADEASALVVVDLSSPSDPALVPVRLTGAVAAGATLAGAARLPVGFGADASDIEALETLVSDNPSMDLGSAAEDVTIVMQFDRVAPAATIQSFELQIGQGEPARFVETVLDLDWTSADCS